MGTRAAGCLCLIRDPLWTMKLGLDVLPAWGAWDFQMQAMMELAYLHVCVCVCVERACVCYIVQPISRIHPLTFSELTTFVKRTNAPLSSFSFLKRVGNVPLGSSLRK